jgi:hypothetical protein
MPKQMNTEEMLARVRQKMQEKSKSRRDPDEFRPPKAKDNETLEFYFRVLPELSKGDNCKTGVCENGMDLWYLENGCHFHDNERHECPRLHDQEECAMCQLGFDLQKDIEGDEAKKKIRDQYLARSYYAMNVYFLNIAKNPESVRGKILWFNSPRQIWTKMEACILSDDEGDSEEPKACGLFTDPYANGYTFKLSVRKKGDYNTYEDSQFLPKSKGPLVKDESHKANEAAIQQILDQRHSLTAKFKPRDKEKLKAMAAAMLKKESGADADDENVEEISGITKGGAKALANKPKSAPKQEESKPAPANTDEDLEETPKPKTKTETKTEEVEKKEVKKEETKEVKTEAAVEQDDPALQLLLNQIKNKKK